MQRPIDMRFKAHPLFGQLAQASKAHHLESAAICQNGTIPIHEFMEPAQGINPLSRGAQHQMIGISKQNIRPRGAHRVRHHRLDRRCGAHRHEGRRADIPARG